MYRNRILCMIVLFEFFVSLIKCDIKYIIPSVTRNFDDAEQYCHDNYGTGLATIHSDSDEIEVELLCREIAGGWCWIGLKRADNNSPFLWIDSSTVDFTYYGLYITDNEHCIHLYDGDQWRWATQPCSGVYRFACNAPLNTKFEQYYGNKVIYAPNYDNYFRVDFTMDWFEARWICQNIFGGDLASNIVTQSVDDEINNLAAGWSFFGLYVPITGHSFWSDGNKFDKNIYNGYLSGEPNNRLALCDALNFNKDWHDITCYGDETFICQKEQQPNTNKVVPELNAIGKNYNENNGFINYILVNDQRRNFNDAEQYCQTTYGTHLASVHNERQAIEVELLCKGMVNEWCWIGLKRDIGTSTTDWKWTDSSNVDYQHFGSAITNNENCIHLYDADQWRWATQPCTYAYYFLCNAPANKKYEDIYEVDYSYFHNFLALPSITKGLNWWESRFLCQQYFNTDLAKVNNRDLNFESNQLCWQQNHNDKNCWIGIFNSILTHSFWSSDSGVIVDQYNANTHYSNFGASNGFPMNPDKKCGILNSNNAWDNKWDNTYCSDNRLFLCNSDKPSIEQSSSLKTQCNNAQGISFIFVDKTLKFDDAEQYCQTTYGTHLASIHNKYEQIEAEAYCKSVKQWCWIGLHRDPVDGTNNNAWKWTDNTAVDFYYVNDAITNNENCMHLWNDRLWSWATEPCTDQLRFLCKAPQNNNRYEDHYRYTYSTNHQFIATSLLNQGYYESNFLCKKWFGTNLADVSTSNLDLESLDLCGHISNTDTTSALCWIGLWNPVNFHTFYIDSILNKNFYRDNYYQNKYLNWINNNEPGDNYKLCIYGTPASGNNYWDDQNCESEYRFVCDAKCDNGQEQNFIITPQKLVENNFLLVSKQPRYIFVKEAKTFDNAEQYCITNYGTHLASVHNEENEIELELLAREANDGWWWIGLKRSSNTDPWLWVDNSNVDFDWFGNNITPNEHCIHLYNSENYKWATQPCSGSYYFVCNAPSSNNNNNNNNNNPITFFQNYYFSNNIIASPNNNYVGIKDMTVRWFEGQYLCKKIFGTNLAKIKTDNDNSDVHALCKLLGGSYCWFGMFNGITSHTFWVDNEDSDKLLFNKYFSTSYKFPINDNLKCIGIYNGNGNWYNLDCAVQYQFICEYSLTYSPTNNPTTSQPTPQPTNEPCKENTVRNIQFILDESGSVGVNNWNNLIVPFTTNTIQRDMNAVSLVDVFSFSNANNNIYQFDNLPQYPRDTVIAAINTATYHGGGTYTMNAVQEGINRFKNSNSVTNNQGSNVMFLVTDGVPTNGYSPCNDFTGNPSLRQQMDALNIKFVLIGVNANGQFSKTEMECLLSDPNKDFYEITSWSPNDFETLSKEIRQYTCGDTVSATTTAEMIDQFIHISNGYLYSNYFNNCQFYTLIVVGCVLLYVIIDIFRKYFYEKNKEAEFLNSTLEQQDV